ncbi:hypothetical protein DIPPA_14255 [Diplonema papillatum]|nr:hypothetical protein DIPPA_14255 [Diplonema papillatum]
MALVEGMPECPICFNNFDSEDVLPLLLPACGHCLCKSCLASMLACNDTRRLCCPHCREPFAKKRGVSVSTFARNWTLLEAIDAVKKAEERDKRDVFSLSSFGFDALSTSASTANASTSSSGGCTSSTAGSSAGTVSADMWICTKCTLHNRITDSLCDACQTPRPKRRRPSSRVKNPSLARQVTLVEEPPDHDPTSFLERITSQYGLD